MCIPAILDEVQVHLPSGAGRWCPEEEAGIWGRLFFSFCNGLISKGKQKALNAEDVWDLHYSDQAPHVSEVWMAQLAAPCMLVLTTCLSHLLYSAA